MLIVLFVAVGVSLVGSFLCSLCEAALYSVSDSKVASMVHEGRQGARRLQKLRRNIDQAIAAILTINTVAHTVGAAVAGAAMQLLYGDIALAIFSGVFTLAILFATEIIPKSIGVARANTLAPRLAWMVQLMIWCTYPLVILCEKLTLAINRDQVKQAPTEHEILSLTRMAARLGSLNRHEAEMVRNALKLDEVTIEEIMTPRSVVVTLPDSLPLAQVEKQAQHWVHSRLPVVRESNRDDVRGVVHRRDVFDLLANDAEGDRTIADVMRPARFIRSDAGVDEALRDFLAGRQHMFIVHDQYGSFVGIVTLEDVLETLLGQEIVGEHDPVADMQDLARQRAAARGLDTSEREDEDDGARDAGDEFDEEYEDDDESDATLDESRERPAPRSGEGDQDSTLLSPPTGMTPAEREMRRREVGPMDLGDDGAEDQGGAAEPERDRWSTRMGEPVRRSEREDR